jgi:hypothetical protein
MDTKFQTLMECNEAHKNTLKEEILQEITEFHGDVTRQCEPKRTGGTQEIPRQ